LFGGQFSHQDQAGLNGTLLHSELPAYAAAITNSTNDYNGIWYFNSPYDVPNFNYVTGASRSLVYLRGTNQIAYYDRAATGTTSLSKALYQVTTGTPTVSGNTGYWLTRSGTQKVYLTSLLPSGGTLAAVPLAAYPVTSATYSNLQNGTTETATATCTMADGSTAACSTLARWTAPSAGWSSSNTSVATINSSGLVTAVGLGSTTITATIDGITGYGNLNVVSGASSGSWSNVSDTDQTYDWEVASSLEVNAGSTASTQFLTAMEFGSSSFSKSTTTLVQSSAGQSFDCALIGTSMVCFMRT
jgi:hypothetical protein